MKPGVDVVEGFSQRNLILNRCYRVGAAVLLPLTWAFRIRFSAARYSFLSSSS
jgi:hypothetical protein